MKKKTFLVFILFLTWLNYLLSYEYVKTMMDTADASKVSNTIVLLVWMVQSGVWAGSEIRRNSDMKSRFRSVR